jgi:hypothetical protein
MVAIPGTRLNSRCGVRLACDTRQRMEQRVDEAAGTAQRVRDVLSARGLTLYGVSDRSGKLFGRPSLFYVPHNLYHRLEESSFIPTIHQTLALSHITGYGLPHWLKVFGFDLDAIFHLQLRIRRKQTMVLDATVYDNQTWVPWLAERPGTGAVPPVVPLAQLLSWGAPRRAAELIGANDENHFVYARIGEQDVYAQPYFVPGQIVRADKTRKPELFPEANAEGRFFLIERATGWSCTRLLRLDGDRVLLKCPQQPCVERELHLERGGRILGAIDAEIRTLPLLQARDLRSIETKPRIHRSRPAVERPTLRSLLRQARIRSGLSFREASEMSRRVSEALSDPLYFAGSGTLSDYEASDTPPRQIPKILTICILYAVPFYSFLRTCGLPLDRAGRDAIPDAILPRPRPHEDGEPSGRDASTAASAGLLQAILREWREVPLFLRYGLGELTGMKNLSLSDIFLVRADGAAGDPLLVGGALVAVNRRARKPASSEQEPFCKPPLYLVLLRNGTYECGRYTLDGGILTLHGSRESGRERETLRNGIDAEVIGRITTIVRRFV